MDLKIIIYDNTWDKTLEALKMLSGIIENAEGDTSGVVKDDDGAELGEWSYEYT